MRNCIIINILKTNIHIYMNALSNKMSFFTLIIALVGLNFLRASNPPMYKCSFCLTSSASNLELASSFQSACEKSFGRDVCEQTFGGAELFEKVPTPIISASLSPEQFCYTQGFCPHPDVWSQKSPLAVASSASADIDMDIRVSKALGSRGYNKVRVSAITNSHLPLDSTSSAFQFSEQFKYRWTDKFLASGIVDLVPGTINSITLNANKSVEIYLPNVGEGVRGVIIADPCFQSKWIVCAYENKFQMYNHTIELLNAINAHSDVHYWQILGDNFYDQDGLATSTWFSSLSDASKSKIFASVPGNHDFWVNASPNLWVPADQQGNGFMQFYAQDVISASTSAPFEPFDFSVNPDVNKGAENLPSAGNFFFYNQVGNTGFIGFSGAHSFDQSTKYFEEACGYFSSSDADSLQNVLLLGHWDFNNDGCDSNSSTPAVFRELLALPACQAIATKLRYMVGHKHCNKVWEAGVGFMVGAQGMEDFSCNPAFGIPVVDTTNGQFKIYYFPINEVVMVNGKFVDNDNFDVVLNCIKSHGVSGCYHLAIDWTAIN